MIKVLWLSPNFNHYKARFLNHLAKTDAINLSIISGTGRNAMGDQELDENWGFSHFKVAANKKNFGIAKEVRKVLKKEFDNYDWVLIPAEKKNILLFLYALWLQFKNKKTKLFSYNHPVLKSGNGKITVLDKVLSKFFYRFLDRVIFYTEDSYTWAVQNKYINPKKAYWVNNTIDDIEVKNNYTFCVPNFKDKRIVFIGRLIPSKRIDLLIDYFAALQKSLPNKNLSLDIIGDGPDKIFVEKAMKINATINWYGTLVEERDIAPIIKKSSLVFIPGLSGLSINHAFAYGRPYITINSNGHGPELNYIQNGTNGFILNGNFEENVDSIKELLLDNVKLNELCMNAYDKGGELSVSNWVHKMAINLAYE